MRARGREFRRQGSTVTLLGAGLAREGMQHKMLIEKKKYSLKKRRCPFWMRGELEDAGGGDRGQRDI